MVNLDNISYLAYFRTLIWASVISSIAFGIIMNEDWLNIFNIIKIIVGIPILFIPFYIGAVFTTILPFTFIICVISITQLKWIYTIGGIFTSFIPLLWAFADGNIVVMLYFVLLGAFCGWNYHRLLMQEKKKLIKNG